LRCRLVVPRAPGLSAVHRNDRTLVGTQQNNVGIVRIDPNILIIVAAGRAAPTVVVFSAVRRFPTNDAGRVNDLRIVRIEPHHRQITTPDPETRSRVVGCAVPCLAGVI
jgi:hypothetical protein